MATTTSARSRGLANYAMPSGSNSGSDKPQQSISSGFAGSNLYPNKNIWNPSYTTSRDRSLGSRESDDVPAGSSALHATSEAEVWGSSPWTNDGQNRPVSTSPHRTRDGSTHRSSASFFDRSISLNNSNGFANKGFQSEANGYGAPFSNAQQNKLNGHDGAYGSAFPQSRDPSAPPSRQSQGSPAFPDMYRGHTPSTSINSQRVVPNHAASLSMQSANQRAFNLNRQIDDDMAAQFNRVALQNQPTNGQSFNPASQSFQMNPSSQPWLNDGNAPRFGNPIDVNGDNLVSQLSAMRRPSTDRSSPAGGYRLDSASSSRSYAPTPDPWASRPSPRDPRTAEIDHRQSMQQFNNNMGASYYANQYQFSNFPGQYAPAMFDPYGNGTNFRNALPQTYGVPSLGGNYQLGSHVPMQGRQMRHQDLEKGARSAVLDEFRTHHKTSKKFELKDIYGHVVEFSGDQHGSRFIQHKLETANSDEKDVVFREIEPNAVQLMKDVFGNYVVQKFFEFGNQVQKRILADKMKGKVVDLSIQTYACRPVQKALEHVLVEQQAEICEELSQDTVKLMKDGNGNHVIQKVIELVPREHLDFVMDTMRGQVTPLAQHMYGCRVVQRMLERGTDADKDEMLAELFPVANMLITDQFGNYVAQNIIFKGRPHDSTRMIQIVMEDLVSFSKHKFASNVVEKAIQYGTPEQRTIIRQQLTATGADGNGLLPQMMRDQFGNYVVQKLLVSLDGEEKETLAEEIKPHYWALKKHGNTRQLLAMGEALGLMQAANGKSGRPGSRANQNGNDSPAPTPGLTETNSPQSSSPPSTHASALEQHSTGEGTKPPTNDTANGAAPQVEENST